MNSSVFKSITLTLKLCTIIFFCFNLNAHARVLDDFDDNKVKGWDKFDFGSGNGYLKEENGQLTIGMHQAPKQQFFVAATYSAETFTVEDGNTLEFSVDLVGANQADSFAVLSFIPKEYDVSSLTGYSFAKDVNDLLFAKGLNKYFYDTTEGDWLDREENVRLVLSMTGSGNSVSVTTRILDLDNNGAVLFEDTTIDTVEVEEFSTGDDDPAGSFIGKPGNFVLLVYHNDTNGSLPPSTVTLDNAKVVNYKSGNLDDFDDNKVKGWDKFDFGSGNGYLKEENGQLTIGMHQAPKQQFFVAATYSAETFTVEDGNTLEFSVDLVGANQADSFAVLSFIPKEYDVSSLTGYSFAKDVNDLLFAKGLNKYFYDTTEGDWLDREENVRLVLSMTGSGNSVSVTTRILDLDNNGAVLFEDTTIDTVEVEEFSTGDDDPAGSFIGKPGNFVLLVYHNDTNGSLPPSTVTLDNAKVSVSGASGKNKPPVIADVYPVASSNYINSNERLSFIVNDDQELEPSGVSVHLNGIKYTTANGLKAIPNGKILEVSLGGLRKDENYHAILEAVDAEGQKDIRNLYFDTFNSNSFVIEMEDFNFDGGEFIDSPIVIPEFDEEGDLNWEDNSYQATEGYVDIDYFDNNADLDPASHRYRPNDGVVTTPALDLLREKFVDAGGNEKGVVDFSIAEIEEGEWLNYTRTFPAGDYRVYLRQAQFTIASAISTLELVTSATDEEEQTTEIIGTFLGSDSGVQYRNVALTNDSGDQLITLNLAGETTLRLKQSTTDTQDFYLKQNYLIFVKHEEPAIELQFSNSVQGPYKTAAGAIIDKGSKTITITREEAVQFYRLKGASFKITKIELADSKVNLSYQ